MNIQNSTPKKAVVVDDELITRMDFSGMLSDMGYQVVGEAADGFDAVEICREKRPDFVLMDISMPIFDGMSATEQILSADPAPAVLILSAFSDGPTVKKAAALGVNAYLVKPVDKYALFAAVEIALANASREAGLREQKEKAEALLSEWKTVDKAKRALALSESIPESEAYRKIQKISMDKRCSMVTVAESILRTHTDSVPVKKAKALLMQKNMTEKQAYKAISSFAAERDLSLPDAAEIILAQGGIPQ